MLDGRRHMCRVIAEMFGQAIQIGQEKLVHNPYGAARGVLVYDGFITLPSGKMDAIVLDICEYGLQLTTFLMAVPYRPNSSPEGLTAIAISLALSDWRTKTVFEELQYSLDSQSESVRQRYSLFSNES